MSNYQPQFNNQNSQHNKANQGIPNIDKTNLYLNEINSLIQQNSQNYCKLHRICQ